MEGAQAYFSHFSPRAITKTFSDASIKLKEEYNVPSLNPLFYLNPLTLRHQLNDAHTLHNILRVLVVVVAYLLLRPHLETLMRKLSGAPEKREEVLRARVARMREEERREKKGK